MKIMSFRSYSLRNAKIQTKLFAGLILLVSIGAVAGYLSSVSTIKASNDFDKIIDTSVPQVIALLQLKNSSSEIETNIAEITAVQGKTTQEGGQAADIKHQLLASLERLQDAQIDYNRHVVSDDQQDSEELNMATDAVVRATSDLASAREQQVPIMALNILQEKVHGTVEKLSEIADHAVDNQIHAINLQDARADELTATLVRRNVLFQLFALGLAIIIGIVMSRLIAQPLNKLRKGVEEISAGKLDKKIPVYSGDEIGQLAKAFNTMSRQLKVTYQELDDEKAGVERQVVLRTKQLSEEHVRFVASINSLALGFMMTDVLDHVIYSNPTLWRILGIKATKSIEEVMDKLDNMLDLQERIKHCRTTKKVTNLNDLTYGSKVLRMFLSPVFDTDNSRILGVVVLLEDITEAKVLERSKDEFFSIASHELRTPLTAIRGNSSMIQQLYKDKLKSNDLNQMVDDIHDSSTRLIEIVNDFLDVSSVEQGKMEFKQESFDILEIIENVDYELAFLCKERHLYLKCDKTLKSLPYVLADKNRLKQVLYNLTGNALKFTEKGGVTIAATVDGKFLRVRIEDTGRGIPLDKQSLLFRKFQQTGESLFTRDTTRGTGLGLYISKLFIEHMGGQLKLDHSEVEKGSTFSFTVPLAPEQNPPDHSEHA